MKKLSLIAVIMVLLVAGCKNDSTGPKYPSDADEILDYGIIYARYGESWWSVQDGKRWNEVNILATGEMVLKVNNTASVLDFGSFRFYVADLSEPDANRVIEVSFTNQATTTIRLNAYNSAWNTEKYVEIRFACYAGCDEE
jgi:hypothetical protein